MDERWLILIGVFDYFTDRHAGDHRTVKLACKQEAEGTFYRVVVQHGRMEERRHNGFKLCPEMNLTPYGFPKGSRYSEFLNLIFLGELFGVSFVNC